VQRSVAARRTAANLHASGVANLLLGKDDAAIDTLHEALLSETEEHTVAAAIEESDNVTLLNDLAAALSNRAINKRRPIPDAAEAFRCADRAWRIGSTPEAASAAAWNDYLAIDQTSPWAAEARKRIAH